MQQSDFQRFKVLMNGMAKLYERELDSAVMDAYWVSLRGWELADFEVSCGHLMRTSRFMPRPVDFEELRNAGRETAGEAWLRARDACTSSVVAGHVTNGGTCGDHLIDRAVRAVGGYGLIYLTETEKLPFLERRFCEHYEAMQDADETRESVPQIAYAPSSRSLNGPQRLLESLPDAWREPQ